MRGKVKFNEGTLGANGVPILIDNKPYKLYGELSLVEGERYFYLD